MASFAPRPFYFITTKGSTALVEEINTAIQSINQTDPHYTMDLYTKYFVPPDNVLRLTDEERAYIQQAGKLRVGLLLDSPPFQYRDEETGQIRGLAVDLLQHITNQTGLTFELVPASTQAELDAFIERHEVDLVAGQPYDYVTARRQQVVLTRTYVSSECILVLNEGVEADSLDGKRLARTRTLVFDDDTDGMVLLYDTVGECIQALLNGEADYTYGDGYSIQYYINQPAYGKLKLMPQTGEPYRACFGVVKPSRYELISIMNKTMAGIQQDELQSIIYQNTIYRREFLSLIHI